MVSIIIPYIDEHDYLADALASASGQHGVDVEIILVCNVRAIPEGYNPLPEEIKGFVFIHEPRSGSAHARNAGLHAASGEWVQFLDVDDLLDPEKIHHQLAFPEADAIVSPHTYVYLNGNEENSKWLPQDIWIGLLNSGLGSTSSMLWKRQSLLDIGGWSTDYQSHQEYELLFRLLESGKKVIPNDHCETLVRQRISGSITVTSKPVRVTEGIRLRETIWNYLVSQRVDTPDRFEAFRQYIFRQLRGLFRQDQQEALALYEKYFSKMPFTPKDIHIPGYDILYRLFGFKYTEAIIKFFVSHRT